jgi:hypothetical protein
MIIIILNIIIKYLIIFLIICIYLPIKSEPTVPPQPKTLLKSFPVPKGIMAKGTLSISILCYTISVITQVIVPSPPPIINLM